MLFDTLIMVVMRMDNIPYIAADCNRPSTFHTQRFKRMQPAAVAAFQYFVFPGKAIRRNFSRCTSKPSTLLLFLLSADALSRV